MSKSLENNPSNYWVLNHLVRKLHTILQCCCCDLIFFPVQICRSGWIFSVLFFWSINYCKEFLLLVWLKLIICDWSYIAVLILCFYVSLSWSWEVCKYQCYTLIPCSLLCIVPCFFFVSWRWLMTLVGVAAFNDHHCSVGNQTSVFRRKNTELLLKMTWKHEKSTLYIILITFME